MEVCWQQRIINFNAGPAALPLPVLQTVQKELLNYAHCSGMSVMEMSHRSAAFGAVVKEARDNLLSLLSIDEATHSVLFLAGGGTAQFASVALNLGIEGRSADYLVTGRWSKAAAAEAKKFTSVNVVGSGGPDFNDVPDNETLKFSENASYFYCCSNETVNGVQIDPLEYAPEGAVVVADMSSDILTRPLDISKYGVIFAGAQKNVGIAGVTIVIVRKDLLGRASPQCPVVLDYTQQDAKDSMYNTPPTFPIYVCGVAAKHYVELGGLQVLQKLSCKKRDLVYNVLDSSGFWQPIVAERARSAVNVVFRLKNRELEKKLVEEAASAGFIGINGHRSVGGLRISLYNAIRYEDVEKLMTFLVEFAERNKE